MWALHMSDEIKAYVTYVKTSFSDVIKAFGLFILISAGPLIAALLNVGGLDGWTVLYIATIEETIAFVVLFIFGKKGLIFKNLRQENFQKSKKQEQKAEPDAEE